MHARVYVARSEQMIEKTISHVNSWANWPSWRNALQMIRDGNWHEGWDAICFLDQVQNLQYIICVQTHHALHDISLACLKGAGTLLWHLFIGLLSKAKVWACWHVCFTCRQTVQAGLVRPSTRNKFQTTQSGWIATCYNIWNGAMAFIHILFLCAGVDDVLLLNMT